MSDAEKNTINLYLSNKAQDIGDFLSKEVLIF